MIFRFRIESIINYKLILLIGLSISIGSNASYGQVNDSLWMLGWHSEWDDSVHEFKITFETPEEEDYGEIEATWAHLNDFTQWDYSIGEYGGSINQKWPRRDDEWELRSDEGNTTTIKNRWRDDNSEVLINFNNEINVVWLSKSFNDGNTWLLYKNEYGEFEFYTEYIDDPRDWIIYDDTSLDLPIDVKVACCFIAMYRATAQLR